MAQVYKVMVRCPKTQEALDTGIRTSGRDALSGNLYRAGTVHCRFCGQTHRFDGNAFVQPDTTELRNDLWRPNP